MSPPPGHVTVQLVGDRAKMLESLLVKASCAERVRARGETLLEKVSKINFAYPNYLCFICYGRGRSDKCRPLVLNPLVVIKALALGTADFFCL